MGFPGVPRWCGGHHPVGDAESGPIRLSFNPQLRIEFRAATITSDAGLLLPRELDERLGLSALIERHLTDPRTGRNSQFPLRDLFRQSPSTVAWPGTRTPTTRSGWPRTRHFACSPRVSGEKPVSRSRPPCIGSKRMSSPESETTKDSLA